MSIECCVANCEALVADRAATAVACIMNCVLQLYHSIKLFGGEGYLMQCEQQQLKLRQEQQREIIAII